MAGPVRIAILANGSQASKTFRGIGKDADSMGTRIAGAAKKAALGLAVVGAGAAVKFTKDAAVLDTKLREVVTLFGETGKAAERSLGVVRGQVRSLSNEFGIAQETLTGGLYQAISAGVPRENALTFMRVASKAAIGGVTDVETAVDGISTTINAFRLKARDAERVADSMFATVKGGKTNFAQLSSSLFNVAPAAAAAGVSFQEVNAAIATLTAGGTPTSVATTQIRAALVGLQRPSADLDRIFSNLGFKNAELAIKSKGLGFALRAVKAASKGSSGELQRLLGSTEAVSAANVLAGTGAEKFTAELKNQKNAAGAASDAFKTVNKGAERQFTILKNNLRNVGLSIGTALLPPLAKVSKALAGEVGPAVDKVTVFFSENKDEIRDTAASIKDTLLPPLKVVGQVLATVAGFAADVPGPVRDIGIQVGIAALVFPRLTAGVSTATAAITLQIARMKQLQAEMTYTATRGAAVQGAMTKLGGAAKAAAGIGGMVALTQGMQQSNKATGTLLTTLGAAATGFALGGPWGLAIGGAAGLIGSLTRQQQLSQEAFRASIKINEDYAASFDQVTGAITKSTKAAAFRNLENTGAFDVSRLIGIPDRELVASVTGDVEALERIIDRVNKLTGTRKQLSGPDGDLFFFNKQSASDFINSLRVGEQQLTKEQRAFIRALDSAKSFKETLKGIPKHARTEFKALGIAPATKEVAKLANKYRLTPKQVRTVLKAVGGDATVKDVERVRKALRDTGRERPDLGPFTRGVEDGVRKGKGAVDRGGRDIRRGLRDAGKTPIDDGWLQSLTRGLTSGKGRASSGGREIGNNLKSGVLSGIGGLEALLSGQVTSAVNAAIAAGRRAADARSPSRKMEKLGRDLADGLVLGMSRGERESSRASRRLVQQILGGITTGDISKVRDSLGRLNDLVQRYYSKRFKNEKRAREETRKALKSLRSEERAVRRNGQLREKIARKLERAEQKLQDLQRQRADYARAVKDAALDYANITNLDTAFNADALAAGLQKRLDKLRQFASLIADLTARGLNATTLNQLIQGGVEGSLAEALALQQGGQDAINSINSIQEEINKVADQFGNTTADTMYEAGIQAAEGLLKGLEAKRKDLERIARQLAKDLVKAIKKELGIKSPSAVFRDLGKQTALGLSIGLEDVHVKRAGSVLAADLLSGFGRPELTATAALGSVAGMQPIHVTGDFRLTAEQVSLVQQGKEITVRLDAYSAAGGKVRA